MKKLYHSAGKFNDTFGAYDILFTRGETDIMMQRDAEAGVFVDELIGQLASEASKLKERLEEIPVPFKLHKYYMFGVGRYAVGTMTTTARLIVGVAHSPPKQLDRAEIYDRARWRVMSQEEAIAQV